MLCYTLTGGGTPSAGSSCGVPEGLNSGAHELSGGCGELNGGRGCQAGVGSEACSVLCL
jgi:hypothetical protein